jgi:hypothetical protein
MKNSFSSINRLLIGAIVLLPLLSISYSCTKSSTTYPNTSDGTFSYTFDTDGTFTYHCKVHPIMTSSVIVKLHTTGY